MINKIEIYEAAKEGYETKLKYGAWRIGLITPAERFTNITYLERHDLTDEAFILLNGAATLLHLDGEERLHSYEMEIGKIYNVPVGGWHNVRIEPDSLVMVVENAETSKENSEYRDFDGVR